MLKRVKSAARSVTSRYRSYRRDRDYRFLIFACPRTGSTSLARAINCYFGVQCALEPFSADWDGNVRQRIIDVNSLRREVQALWKRYNGFKHVWEPNGFPFQGHPELNDYLLTAATDRVVFLNRRNVLRRIVSWHIADQVKMFHLWEENDRSRLLSYRFQPLDRESIREELLRERNAFSVVIKRVSDARVPFMTLWYEDIFRAGDEEGQRATFEDVIAFITGRPFLGKNVRPIAFDILDSSNTRLKMNSAETYELVPNIHEIEAELGSDQTGYLFR